MALVEISFISPFGIGPRDNAAFSSSQMITSSASNQISTLGATVTGETCIVASSGGAVYVAFGLAPDATVAGTRRLIPDGVIRAFGGLTTGHKAAIVNAT